MINRVMTVAGFSVVGLSGAIAQAGAQVLTGQPTPNGLGLQPPANDLAQQLYGFHDVLLIIITLIALFVTGLLIYVMVRFRKSANPNPTKITHNLKLEIAWTVIPVLILAGICFPSLALLYAQDDTPENIELTVKAIGKQWYWTYEYPDHGSFEIDSIMLTDEEAEAAGKPRLLATDNPLVLPADTNIRVQITAGDVLHAFTVPAFGVKRDAVPGRLNEVWISEVSEPGTYYGQCSELCGTAHAYMPIEVKIVPKEEFEAWVKQAQEEYGEVKPTTAVKVAAAQR